MGELEDMVDMGVGHVKHPRIIKMNQMMTVLQKVIHQVKRQVAAISHREFWKIHVLVQSNEMKFSHCVATSGIYALVFVTTMFLPVFCTVFFTIVVHRYLCQCSVTTQTLYCEGEGGGPAVGPG